MGVRSASAGSTLAATTAIGLIRRRPAPRRNPAPSARAPRLPRRPAGAAPGRRQHDTRRRPVPAPPRLTDSSTCPTVSHGCGSRVPGQMANRSGARTAGNTGLVGRSLHGHVERRRPQQHAASPDATLEHGRRPGVEAREHLRALGRRDGCDIRTRGIVEKSPLRGARNGSNTGCPYSSAPTRAASPRVRSTGCPIVAGQHVDLLRPACARPGRHEQPSALLDEARESPRQRRVDLDVVQHDDGAAAQVVIGQRLGLADDGFELRRFADRQHAGEIQPRRRVPAIDHA